MRSVEPTKLVLPAGATSVAGLLELLRGRGDAWRDVLVTYAVRVTVNRGFAIAETVIADGDEIALVPKRV